MITISSRQDAVPRVGILVATHGNETAGFAALDALLSEFIIKGRPLLKGELSVAIGNPEAVAAAKRHCGQDLNRLFAPINELAREGLVAVGSDYKRSLELLPWLRSLDYFLDLHSANKPIPPVAITLGPSETALPLLNGFPIDTVLSNAERIVTGSAIGTVTDADGIGVAIECGQHTQAGGIGGKVATECAMRFLENIGLAEFSDLPDRMAPPVIAPRLLAGLNCVKAADPGTFRWSKNYSNWQELIPDELLATDFLQEYRAPDEPGLLILFPTLIEHLRSGETREAYTIARKVKI